MFRQSCIRQSCIQQSRIQQRRIDRNRVDQNRRSATFLTVSEWSVEYSAGLAGPFHHRDLAVVVDPTVWVHAVERPALVLGSSQRDHIIDHDAAARLGVEVCSRRSGGGLVLVEPNESCWIDVLIPPSHPSWSDDVNSAFHWVGDVWRSALESLDVADLSVHTGGLENGDAGRFLCFAGIGPGEVIQERNGAGTKAVGLSQRRQRTVARFQGLFVNSSDAELLQQLVKPDAWPAGLAADSAAIGIAEPIDISLLPAAFVDALPTGTR